MMTVASLYSAPALARPASSRQLREYVLASWIGTMPGTVLYVYIGSLAQAGAGHTTPAEWVLRGMGLLATLAVTVVLTRVAKRALNKRTI
jgi:uncharacterized membrane protein YdjX (TVP38/TMEM64 family)